MKRSNEEAPGLNLYLSYVLHPFTLINVKPKESIAKKVAGAPVLVLPLLHAIISPFIRCITFQLFVDAHL